MSVIQIQDNESSLPVVKDAELDMTQHIEATWSQAPENVLNVPSVVKWRMIAIVSLQAFVSPLASSIMAPSLPEIGYHYGISSPAILALTLSIFLLAYAVGPLLMGPLSELYGRKPILNISSLLFFVFNVACIFAPNTSALIIFRFFAGIGGSTPLAIGGAVVGDLFNERERAPAVAALFLGILLGPPTGPIMGGFIAETVGFKYGFVLTSSLACLSTVMSFFLLHETYAPVLRARFITQHAASLGVRPEVELSELTGVLQAVDTKHLLWLNLTRPVRLLTQSLICFMLSLYCAIVYGYLNIFFTTFPGVFAEKYGFGPGATGLTYIGGGLGEVLATVLGGFLGNLLYNTLLERNSGVSKPEFRIPAMIPGSFIVPIGLLWYGWSAHAGIHWIMPIIGSSLFGFGMITIFLPVQLYFVDTFTYAASALSASAMLRSMCAFAFPLFAPRMFAAMGLGGGYSLLAGVALLVGVPFPVWLYYYGEQVRASSSLTK